MMTSQAIRATTRVELHARDRLLSLINANWTTQAISVAVTLGIPELLRNGPRSAEVLAAAAKCDARSMWRLLRALTSIDVLREAPDGLFALTPIGASLRADAPSSLAVWARFCGTRSWATWGRLEDSVRTGLSVRRQALGVDGFGHLEHDAEGASLFYRAMVDLTRPIALAVAHTLDFSDVNTVVDVGGGYGQLIATILAEHPSLRGVLFDLAHAIDAAGSLPEIARVADRCALVAGSFFDGVPPDGDAYLLKSILHDWDDEQAGQILGACRQAMRRGARLFLIERIVPELFSNSSRDQGIARSDLNMLAGTGGCERTQEEYGTLLEAAGLKLVRTQPLLDPFSVMEAVVR